MRKTKEMRHIGVNTTHRAIYAIVSLALFATAGCARLSPRSGYLIDETARRVEISRMRENTMTEKWAEQRRKRADEWLRTTGIPNYIKRLVGSPKGKKRFKQKICRAEGTDQAVEIMKFATVIARRMAKMRAEVMDPIEVQTQKILRAADIHYTELDLAVAGLRADIQSYLKVREQRSEILKALDLGGVDKALDDADKALDKLVEIKEAVE